MNKNTYKTIALEKGEINLYDFGQIKLHAYKTNDFMDDEVFIVENNGVAVIIESPCFYDNIAELTAYVNGMEIAGILVAYHGAGAKLFAQCGQICHPKCRGLFAKRGRQGAGRKF